MDVRALKLVIDWQYEFSSPGIKTIPLLSSTMKKPSKIRTTLCQVNATFCEGIKSISLVENEKNSGLLD